MSEAFVLALFRQTLTTGLILLAPILGVSLVIGLAVSIFQALTQVHEMTLTFVPKLIGVGLVLLVLGSWMLQKMLEFTNGVLSGIDLLAP